ncbi:TPA: hypothetical protein ACG7LI_001076 [Streptococcus agalactiae]|uniref:hypothetical protein n=1 Tax=Streptococcus agalactiae TaxID=1311 RepID=UPI0002BBA16A|nr:hypothetical protein [Streptococcus agalactiae]DAV05607.1 MAG TPA: hypothetical protein [Caudoviricetes sp.]AIF86133.1 hypothetical protein EN72_03385 [Streptococcus agalactiae]EPU92314.1 hypothetical protein SAG0319_07070 [Streptococcus agalactiae GB00241]EPU93805.1 hypothetical protein SAG0319_11020 [Streptococcus agalactiae GB00241]EPX42709.1 hypothetical protein SAG0343_07320 [Streptococcus agalactiae GB00874]
MEKEIIKADEKQYELKYNEKTIENIEAITGKAFMSIIMSDKGMLSLTAMRQYFSNALYAVEGGRVSAEQGSIVFEKVLNAKGFAYVNMLIITTIQRDCPFFFLGA